MNKLRVNDEVLVTTGKDKGKTGKILKIFWSRSRVLVEGVNVVKKSIRPTQEAPEGGFAEVERPIHISNVSLQSKDGKPSKVAIRVVDGKNVRVLKKCGTTL